LKTAENEKGFEAVIYRAFFPPGIKKLELMNG
jgi:hypothetical protein